MLYLMHQEKTPLLKFHIRKYTPIIALVILSAISLSPLIEIAEEKLSTHMIFEHAIFFLLGALSVISAERILNMLSHWQSRRLLTDFNNEYRGSSDLHLSKLSILLIGWRNLLRIIFSFDKTGILWISLAIVLMTLWHIPAVFNTAAIDVNVHIMQHFSFIIVGAAGFIFLRIRGESFKVFMLLAIICMMGFEGLIFSVVDQPIYDVYPIWQHHEAGIYMIITSTLLLLVGLPYYLIKRTMVYIKSVGADRKL